MLRLPSNEDKIEKEAMKQSSVTLTTLCSALRAFCPESVYSLRSVFQEYGAFRDHLFRNHGKSFGIKVLKEVHQAMKRHQTGVHVPGSFVPYSMWLSTDSTGLPRRLRLLRRLAVSRYKVCRLVAISLTSAYTLYYDTPKVSLSTVLDPYKGVDKSCPQTDSRHHHVQSFIRFIRWYVPKAFRLQFKSEHRDVFLGVKGGPFGAPSFRFCLVDAIILMRSQFQPLLDLLREFSKSYLSLEGYNRLWTSFAFSHKCCEILGGLGFNIGVSPTDEPRVAKFSFLSEKGGKTRVITACNFWIQSVLYPLHNDVMRLLRTLKSDFTYAQDRAADFAHSFHERGRRFAASYDMTGATDRFPRWVQVEVLNSLKNGLGDIWGQIMSLPIWCEQLGCSHSFSVGQPMGLYSSWPVFSLSHHILVRFCAWACGFDPFTFSDYMILGDDVVIFNRRVARYYRWFLTEVLGVEISTFKSLVTRRRSPFSCEFAKRLFVNSGECSPVTPGILLALRNGDSSLFLSLLDRLLVRWRVETFGPPSDFIKVLCERIVFKRRRTRLLRWLTSPGIFPSWLTLDGDLLKIRERFWSPLDPSLARSFWPIIVRLRREELLWECVKRLSGLRDFTPQMYTLPRSSIFFDRVRRDYFDDNYLAVLPLHRIIHQLQDRIEAAFLDSTYDSGELLILTRWLCNVLAYRTRITGDVYIIKSRREAFESYRLHILARDVAIRSPFGVIRVKGTPFIRPRSWYT